ncbi:histone-lysine N-methyltransferase SETDB1-A isoform X2 [Eleginops maclovinus]|uniref:histone-lysine N-methyltransferase SETDB1-A isoform X2 n=1 Tax=Eleginops maclovinus TaxID=56733 RepID=UPI0030809A26
MEVDEMENKMQESNGSKKKKMESAEVRYDNENMLSSPCDSVPSTSESPHKETQLKYSSDSLSLIKNAVVVLTRLPDYKISALRPPTPQQFYSEDDSFSSSDSDMQWEKDDDSSDSDFSLSNHKRKNRKQNTSRNSNNNEQAPIIVSSAFAHCSTETTKVRPNLPEQEIAVGMMVLAKRKTMKWQRGKIVDIVTKDGRVKYKVCFEEKGRSLVSGHHIAFDTTPELEQLYVGARVVVQFQDNKFRPGVLSELPSRKNRLRFLVFMDNHMPLYMGLPSFHLVCRPLEDVLDDIPDRTHKAFMARYLSDWPYPHLTQYKAGQMLHVKLIQEYQRCEVQAVDCSVMQVQFQDTQEKEWIHRGSVRLQHMARFLDIDTAEVQNDDSD